MGKGCLRGHGEDGSGWDGLNFRYACSAHWAAQDVPLLRHLVMPSSESDQNVWDALPQLVWWFIWGVRPGDSPDAGPWIWPLRGVTDSFGLNRVPWGLRALRNGFCSLYGVLSCCLVVSLIHVVLQVLIVEVQGHEVPPVEDRCEGVTHALFVDSRGGLCTDWGE